MKYVPPSAKETAFNCPHCGALAKQHWLKVYADPLSAKKPLPIIVDSAGAKNFDFKDLKDEDARDQMTAWANKMGKGLPFIERRGGSEYAPYHLWNVSAAECFNCKDVTIWVYDNLLYPKQGEGPPPNPDLPPEIRRDYDEASSILSLSPRGAAALIRLAIQKLCKELGEPGENINADIKALVAKGLNVRVQQALDVVRVIGNNAVHPGEIDLKDDRATAETLFKLLNIIAEKMISEPKHVDEMYASLPQGALDAIERRDKAK
ncbi:DUF4145 domain-containing protein [Leisingera thetidis]|uniref:DUF4145 domain-containing protein n=1 Tax=Leisingera thetidis TaxID=2930199 RepID=UPI0021F707FE|nr:DUF4145 domain-containing protein [Leisingera thetidis]